MKTLLKIELLDGGELQTRSAMSEETVEEYAEVFANANEEDRWDAMPPVSVIYNGATNRHWLTDGFHRVAAAKRVGMTEIACDERPGSRCDALREALKANVTNGLRRNNADKRHALEMAWASRMELFGGEPSNGLLADACGVSTRTVIRFREETGCDNVTPCDVPKTRIGSNGKTYHMTPTCDNVTGCRPQKVRPQLLDRVGQPIPEALRPIFTEKAVKRLVWQFGQLVNDMEENYFSRHSGNTVLGTSTLLGTNTESIEIEL